MKMWLIKKKYRIVKNELNPDLQAAQMYFTHNT